MIKTAEIHKKGTSYEVRLFNNSMYEESFYTTKKRDIKPHLKKLGYVLTYDYSLLNK